MELVQLADMESYLKSDDIIDFGNSIDCKIFALSRQIKTNSTHDTDFIKNAFEYVRDNISHSMDIQSRTVTCRASEVLANGEGLCYAKSHLLAAILRSGGIPCGFCYQQLILNDITAPYLILHGLNVVYIDAISRWIRLDARGNKTGVDAQFSLDEEKLAFVVRTHLGERDIPIIFDQPDPNVVQRLLNKQDIRNVVADLPRNLEY